jgi:dipeptidyl-peptidase-4
VRWLADHKRFIWQSERNGFANYYLYDVSGRLINPITTGATFEAANIVKVDETAGVMFYMARDGDNYMKQQSPSRGPGRQRVTCRLTDPKFTHSVNVSPDDKFFTDVYQTHDTPPATQLVDMSGKVIAQLAAE